MGLVAAGATGRRDRVPYRITKEGRAEFAAWIGREPEGDVMRLPLAVTVFFGRHVDPALLRRYLQAARIAHQKQHDHYVAIRPEVTEVFSRETLQLGIAYEEMWIRWLDGLPWIKEPKTRR